MVRVLLDACVPHRLRLALSEFDVETSHHAGFDHLPDRSLLDVIDGIYDVLVTCDRNLTFQQKIVGRAVAVIVLRSIDQSPAALESLLPELKAAVGTAAPGTVTLIGATEP